MEEGTQKKRHVALIAAKRQMGRRLQQWKMRKRDALFLFRAQAKRIQRYIVEDTNVHFRHLLAGATASIVARSILAPLERIKVEQQLNQRKGGAFVTVSDIIRKEGVAGLWRGNGLNLLRTAPYRSINYYTYDHTRNAILKFTGKSELENVQRLVAGATAGIVAIMCCFPLDVLRTRMLTKGGEHLYRQGLFRTAAHIISTEGPQSLYAGVVPALISLAPSNAVFYSVFDFLKTKHLHSTKSLKAREVSSKIVTRVDHAKADGKSEIDPRWTLVYGGLAGVAAESSVYPLEVIRRRLQLVRIHAASHGRLDTYMKDLVVALSSQKKQIYRLTSINNIRNVLGFIVQREGMKGLYWGIIPTVLQVMPSAAISYYIFELGKVHLNVQQ